MILIASYCTDKRKVLQRPFSLTQYCIYLAKPQVIYKPITPMGFSAMFTFQLQIILSGKHRVTDLFRKLSMGNAFASFILQHMMTPLTQNSQLALLPFQEYYSWIVFLCSRAFYAVKCNRYDTEISFKEFCQPHYSLGSSTCCLAGFFWMLNHVISS